MGVVVFEVDVSELTTGICFIGMRTTKTIQVIKLIKQSWQKNDKRANAHNTIQLTKTIMEISGLELLTLESGNMTEAN